MNYNILQMDDYMFNHNQFKIPSISKIYKASNGNHIYIGDKKTANNFQLLNSKNIKAVITAANQINLYYNSNITHKKYSIVDNQYTAISKYFQDSFKFIQKQIEKGSVLVHCAAGISRSATLVIAYLMRKNNWTYRKAFKMVQSKRDMICPNPGFQRQLYELQNLLMLKIGRLNNYMWPGRSAGKKYITTNSLQKNRKLIRSKFSLQQSRKNENDIYYSAGRLRFNFF